jgi:MoaA/NifB/PqqE/SkfB family radical SAM enzyme
MLHPSFFAMVEFVCSRGAQLKIETNGHYLTPESCARLRDLGVKAVQVSLDGASRATFNRIRVLGEFNRALEGIRHLRDAGVPIEINFSPTRFNTHEIGAAVDLAYELGAYSFYTGRTMYTGNAVKAWRHLEVSDEQYATFFDVLRAKAVEYKGRMRVYFHEAGLLEELRYRLQEPAALLHRAAQRPRQAHQRPALHLRRPAHAVARRRLGNFQRAWRDPRVAEFVDDLARDPGPHAHAAQWVHL